MTDTSEPRPHGALPVPPMLSPASPGDTPGAAPTGRVGLAFDASAADSHEGRCAIELTLRLLIREWSGVSIVDLTGRHGGFADALAALARSIQPEVSLSAVPDGAVVTLVVGDTAVEGQWPALYVGSRGWVARFSPDRPVGSGTTDNPFGAAAGACLGVANAYRLAHPEACRHGAGPALDADVAVSVYDYSRGSGAANPRLPAVDLDTTHLLGLDGIGSAVVWTLARLRNVGGALHLIDGSAIEPSALRTNVLTSHGDVGRRTIDVAAEALAGSAVDVRVHASSWAHYIAEREDRVLPRVAVASGTAPERAAVQASLPRVVLNAWTGMDDVGLSRHHDFLRTPCLACLYWPRDHAPSPAQLVAAGIGLPAAQLEVQDMLHDGRLVDRALLERVAAAEGVQVASLLPFVGTPADVFHRRAVGEGALNGEGGQRGGSRHSRMAFQAALAGVFLAAEIVVDAALARPPLPTLTRVDLLRPLPEYLTGPAARDPQGWCLCGDADYREVYARKYLTCDAAVAGPR